MPEKRGQIENSTQKVFISYSWDSEEHKAWVLQLADELIKNGVDVLLDQYELRLGRNLNYFMESSAEYADKIIAVFTQNYKLKADGRAGGVGFEYSMINAELYKNQIANNKIIPILRQGDSETSIPNFIKSFIWLDMRDDNIFENKFEILLREIYNEPEIKKPKIGMRPTFSSSLPSQGDIQDEVKRYDNFDWLEKTPEHLETFDFENTASKIFHSYESEVWKGVLENGVYKLINKMDEKAVKYHHLKINNQNMSNFATTVEIQIKDGVYPKSSGGLMFCYDSESKNYYSFTIDNGKQYKLWLRTNSGYQPILSGRTNYIIPNEFNKIGFIKSYGIINIFINDKYLRRVKEDSIKEGDSGIIAISTGEFIFDNLSFYKL